MVNLPEPFASIPRTQLTWPHPAPLHLMPHLTKHLHDTTSSRAQFWAKREDCSSGLGMGGNKIRKLEYIMPEALRLGATTLLTTGGVQSNHMRQVAAVGSSLGLKTVLVPQGAAVPAAATASTAALGDAPSERQRGKQGGDAATLFQRLGNVQVNYILGAENVVTPTGVTLEDVAARVRSEGGVPYVISSGASAHLYGGLGFARWAFEVAEQEKEHGIVFGVIVVPVASGGTLAGIIAGFKLVDQGQGRPASAQKKRAIVGVDTYNKPPGELEGKILDIAQRTTEVLGLGRGAVGPEDVRLDTRYNRGTHTDWDDMAEAGVRELGRTEGIVADPIYSGRAVGAILDMAKKGELDGYGNVLFVHTGGQAALGAFPKLGDHA